jgi:beta-galactosidase
VHIYTSGDEAELFLNGVSLGRKQKESFQYRICWNNVIYQPGELKVTAYKNGKVWASAIIQTTGSAEQIELSADRQLINADGLDLSFITVRITDKYGMTVPTANQLIKFRIEGAGRIEATGNGDATSLESFQASQYKAYHGLCLVIIRSLEAKKGQISLTAESEGLKSGSIIISTK